MNETDKPLQSVALCYVWGEADIKVMSVECWKSISTVKKNKLRKWKWAAGMSRGAILCGVVRNNLIDDT